MKRLLGPIFGLLLVVFCSCHGTALCQQALPFGESQIVMETSYGTIVMEVFPEGAPRHVEHFLERVRSNFYVGTTFHRAVPWGIVQGGDPLSREPSKRGQYGTGGLFELKHEASALSHVRGTVSAVSVPGKPDSTGSQFFICVTDQTQLDGQFTAFARVVEGLEVVARISQAQTDSEQGLLERIEITATFERNRPPPEVVPFADAAVEDLARYSVVLQTDLGQIEIAFYPEDAPAHVRQFLRFAELGMYTGTTFHRVVPEFVIQGGSLQSREPPLEPRHQKYVKALEAEFSGRKHERGVVSMARAEDINSAVDSFFIALRANPHLDGQYTVFGHVVKGMETVEGIAQVPLRGEAPIFPVRIESVHVRQNRTRF